MGTRTVWNNLQFICLPFIILLTYFLEVRIFFKMVYRTGQGPVICRPIFSLVMVNDSDSVSTTAVVNYTGILKQYNIYIDVWVVDRPTLKVWPFCEL